MEYWHYNILRNQLLFIIVALNLWKKKYSKSIMLQKIFQSDAVLVSFTALW